MLPGFVLYKAAPVKFIVAPKGIENEAIDIGTFNLSVVTFRVIGIVPALELVAIVFTQIGIIDLHISR